MPRSQTRLNKTEDGSGPGQGTSAGYEITDGDCVSPHEKTQRKTGETLERRTIRLLEVYHLAEDSAR